MTLQELLTPDDADDSARQLVDRILAGDLDARIVYGDWLMERGLIVDDAPHHGWCGMYPISQDETDYRIRCTLWECSASSPQSARRVLDIKEYTNLDQVGGIDSDPLNRYLARRCWGKRDEDERAIRAILEGYRIKLGLEPWESIKPIQRGNPIIPMSPRPRVRRTGRTTHGILHAIAECVYRGQRMLYIVKPSHIHHEDLRFICMDIVKRLNHPVKLSFAVDMQGKDGVSYLDHSLKHEYPGEPHPAELRANRMQVVHEMAMDGTITLDDANRLMQYPELDVD